MSDRPTSFHDFKWACGHTGPGYCKICRDEQVAALESQLDKDVQLSVSRYKRIQQLEADLKNALTVVARHDPGWVEVHFPKLADKVLAPDGDSPR